MWLGGLSAQPTEHGPDPAKLRLAVGASGEVHQIQRGTGFRGGPQGNPQVVVSGGAVESHPLRDVEHDGLSRAPCLICQVRVPGGKPSGCDPSGDALRQLVAVQ